MTQVISRIYQSNQSAAAAAADLKKAGFTAIHTVAPADAPPDQIPARIRQGGISATHAETFAEGIKRGETLVSVAAPFGTASMAVTLLDKHGPTQTGLTEQGYEQAPPDPDAPFSSAIGWTVLIDNPAPLSSALGWKILSDRRPTPKPDSELVDNPAPFSKSVGAPVLSNQPAVLSSRLGWRLLFENAAPLSNRFHWPLLSKNQKPPQTRLGMSLLSDNPAPLSSRVGWKLLSNDPAPLSRLFGWRVLSEAPKPKH